MALMVRMTVKQALEFVANHQAPSSDAPIEMPVWELVARSLFEIANSPDARVRGSMTRATTAQRMILNRMVGTRPPGTHPAALREEDELEYVDLTVKAVRS